MDEVDAIKSMKAGLEDVDRLLDKIAHQSSVLTEKNEGIISKSELDSFAACFRKEASVDDIRNTIAKIVQSYHNARQQVSDDHSKIVKIPLSILEDNVGDQVEQVVLHLKPSDLIEDTLLLFNVIISINSLGEICTEIPHVDDGYLKNDDVVSSNDAGVMDSKDLLSLKSRDRKKWEKLVSNMEFQCLLQQIYQIISSLDLQMAIDDIDELAKQAICIILAWKERCNFELVSSKALKRFFGKSDRGSFIFKAHNEKNDITSIRCNIGRQKWGDHYGIGMEVEIDKRFDVLWKPKSQAAEDDNFDEVKENSTEFVTSLTCCLQQGFPLIQNNGSNDQLFKDTVTNHDDSFFHYFNTDCVAQDNELSIVSLIFDQKIFPSEEKYQLKAANFKTSKLEDMVKSIDSSHESSEQNLFGTEVFAWGDNSCNCLGLGTSKKNVVELIVKEPSFVPFSPLSSCEPVDSIACSSCHTMLLTKFGTLYSCGDGSDGQLGHNSLESLGEFQLIDFFFNDNDRIVITSISAGSDDTSSHSAAIDSNHNLYTWGKTIICGHIGSDKSPTTSTTVPKMMKAFENQNVLQVSCGGGFTLARIIRKDETNEGVGASIYSWGKTANGRLGIGKPKSKSSSARTRGSQQVPWCLCYPNALRSLEDKEIIDISAGSKHALAVNRSGQVFAWGSNSSGECSAVKMKKSSSVRSDLIRFQSRIVGLENPVSSSLWDDIWIPRLIPYFGTNIKAQKVSAGGIQSAAIDSDGLVYSWGGGGHGDCLGHGDISEYEYGIAEKMDASKRQFQSMSGLLQVPKWAQPRVIEAVKDCRARKVELGTKHGVVLTEQGCIYSWGDQSSNPQMVNPQNTPSHPSDNYLHTLQGKYVENFACGCDRIFCITSGSFLGRNVGASLLRQCELYRSPLGDEDDEDLMTNDQNLIDCSIIVGGRRIYCHKTILASRSDSLKKIILDEERPDERFTEILLPGIQFNVMKQIINYLYMDTIDFTNLSAFQSLLNLYDGASMLKLKSLKAICLQILSTMYQYNVTNHGRDGLAEVHTTVSSLPVDLSEYILQQESKFADVKIIALNDNSIIYGHKCILRYSADYFRQLFDHEYCNQMNSGEMWNSRNVSTIELPGTRTEVLRLLYYLYTGVVAITSETSNDRDEFRINKYIQADLMHAKRFNLPSMKAQCENAILTTPKNSLNVLLLSNTVNSVKLKLDAINMTCKILASYNVDEEGKMDWTDDFNLKLWKEKLGETLLKCPPGYREALFQKIKDINITTMIPKDRKDIALKSLEITKEKKEKAKNRIIDDMTDSDMTNCSFLLKVLMVFVVLIGYLLLQSFFKIHPFITIAVNVIYIVITGMYLLQRI